MRGKYAALEPTAAANAVARANKFWGSSRRAKEPEVVKWKQEGGWWRWEEGWKKAELGTYGKFSLPMHYAHYKFLM